MKKRDLFAMNEMDLKLDIIVIFSCQYKILEIDSLDVDFPYMYVKYFAQEHTLILTSVLRLKKNTHFFSTMHFKL